MIQEILFADLVLGKQCFYLGFELQKVDRLGLVIVAPDRESAKLLLAEYTEAYNWNLEEKTIIKFIELVERRFK